MCVTACWFDEMATFSSSSNIITLTNTTTASTDQWYVFSQQAMAAQYAIQNWARWHVTGQAPNPEAVRAAIARTEEYNREAGLAQRRARALLVQHLTPEQRRTYEQHAYFDVDVNGKTYRVRQGTHGNVRLLERAKVSPAIFATVPAEPPLIEKVSFCAQPSGVPAEDAMLAQKLMLESDERKFLEIANWTDLATGRLMDKRQLLGAR